MTTKIACSPLTGRIFQGRINKDQNAFVGQKKDVTSDVLEAVIGKAEYHGGKFEIEGGDRKWLVKVTEVKLCGCNGMPQPGAMCAAVIVGGKLCGSDKQCVHQKPAGAA